MWCLVLVAVWGCRGFVRCLVGLRVWGLVFCGGCCVVVWMVFWGLLVGVFCLVLLVRWFLVVVVWMVGWVWGLWLVVRGLVRRWVLFLVVVGLLGCLGVLVGVFLVVGLMCRLVRRCWGWVFRWVRLRRFWVGSVLLLV